MSGVKKTLILIAVLVVAMGLWLVVTHEDPSVITAPQIPKCAGCNLILISLDTFRADRLTPDKAPNLAAAARRSLQFNEAFSNAFYTTPSHMTVFTGTYPQKHMVEADEVKVPRTRRGGPASPLPANIETLPEVLRRAGYSTLWSAPLDLKHLDAGLGFGRGFDRRVKPIFRRRAEQILDPFAHFDDDELLKDFARPGRHFAFLHSFVTHMPFVSESADAPPDLHIRHLTKQLSTELRRRPEHYGLNAHALEICTSNRYRECWDEGMDPDAYFHALGQLQLHHWNKRENDRAAIARYARAYDDQVRHLDQQFGILWQDLQAAGLLENTIIAIFSDHGEELFEHGKGSHSSFYEHTVRVPLLIYHPRMKGESTNKLISLVDVMPTLLQILDLPLPSSVQGRSVTQGYSNTIIGFSLGNQFAREPNWKLIRRYDGREELYYLPLDPNESHNLVDIKFPWMRDAYRRLAEALLTGQPP